MAKWAEQAMIVYPSDGQWIAQVKRAPGVHAYGPTAHAAISDLADLLGDMDKSNLDVDPQGTFDPYTPCGSWGCGCCNPHWNEHAFSNTYTELSGTVERITVPQIIQLRSTSGENDG